ncbi:MAG: preprotein translocase subunit SecE [Gammaproteobacteria bacterium]|nr:preprotein translocase subunit SecE [Gammaproteobacteria bacterium]
MDWLNRIKLILAVLLAASGVVAYYVLVDYSDLLRVLVVVAAVIASLAVALWSEPGQAAWTFIRAADREVRKVVWPTRRETIQTTMIVVVMVVIVGFVLWLIDMGLVAALSKLTS